MKRTESGQIQLEDFQIVNGCQTVASIWSSWVDQIDISKVRVLAKIVENPRAGAQDDQLSSQIAERSNRQNVINAEDWKANDKRQERWQDGFRRLPEPWFYEIKRGVWATQYPKTADKAAFRVGQTGQQYRKVTLKDLGQACYAFLGNPAAAQDKPREIFQNDAHYDAVFREDLTPHQLLLPHLIYLEADRKTTKDEPLFALEGGFEVKTNHARFAIVATVGRMLRGLAGTGPGYLSTDHSDALATPRDRWLPAFVEVAFKSVARELARESESKGMGPRSIIRRNDWWDSAASNAEFLIRERMQLDRDVGTPAGSVVAALPF